MMTFALDASDVAVVPVRPTAADVWTMTLMDGRIADAMSGNPGLAAFALINLASTNPRQPSSEKTRRVLKQGCTAMEVAGPTLCDRVAFQRAFAVGRTVEEYGTRAEKAARRARRTVRGRVRRSAHERGFRQGSLSDPNQKKAGDTDLVIQTSPPNRPAAERAAARE